MRNGLKIKKLRENKNLTLEQVGEQFNVSAQSINKWEIGNPPKNRISQLCEFFGVKEDFFEDSESSEKITSELIEELRTTQEFMRDQIQTLNKEKERLMNLLDKALSRGGNFPKGSVARGRVVKMPVDTALRVA